MRTHLRSIAAIAAALILAACEGATPTSEAGASVVNLYTARVSGADQALYALFTERTGIRVNLIPGEADALIARMKRGGDGAPADVFLSADGGSLWRAQQQGLLQPTASPALQAAIPDGLRDPGGLWFGFTRRARVVAYDPAKISPAAIDAYEDIAAPRFRGRLCVRSADSAANLSLVGALIETWGPERAEQWVRGVVANMARSPQGDGAAQIRAIGAGVCQIALASSLDYIALANADAASDRELAQGIKLSFPSLDGQGSHVAVSGGGVAAQAPNRDSAVKLLEFLGSAEAQTVISAKGGEFPASPSVPAPYPMDAWAGFKAHPMAVAAYAQHEAQARAMMAAAGWR